jgi:hypothetical protein
MKNICGEFNFPSNVVICCLELWISRLRVTLEVTGICLGLGLSLACQFLLGHLHNCCPAGFFLAAAAAGYADCLTCRLQPVKDMLEFVVSCSALPIELW